MILDLIANGAYLFINRKLISTLGLEPAVYLTTIIEIARKAKTKNKFDESTGMIKLDRKYIQEMTTIEPAIQKKIDPVLAEFGLVYLDQEDKNKLAIDAAMIEVLISEENSEHLKEISKALKTIEKKQTKTDKSAAIIQMLKNSVVETDLDVRESYWRWIDSAYGKLNKKAQVETMQARLNEYTKDKKVKREILDICASRQYADPTYAFDIYAKAHSTATKLSEQKISTGTKAGVEF